MWYELGLLWQFVASCGLSVSAALEKFITSFFFHHSTQWMVAMCANAQLWWFVIFGISSTCGCFVSRFIRALDVGDGFCVVHLILMWWLVIYYLCFCYLWRMAGDVLRKNFWRAKYLIWIATSSFSLVFVFCALSWRWMLLTIGLQFLFVSFHCMRNLALLLGSSMNQHGTEAHGRWWRTLGGLWACLRFFCKLGFGMLKLYCLVVLC